MCALVTGVQTCALPIWHREFAMASGEMSEAEFIAFLASVFEQLAAFSIDGAIHYQCMDWSHSHEMLTAGRAAYARLMNICVWAKTHAGMGSRSEEHTSDLQSLKRISYAVFCMKKKNIIYH